MIDPRVLAITHAAAVADIRASEAYVLPVPTSHEILAKLRRVGVTADRWEVIAACARDGLELSDAPAHDETCSVCGGVRALLVRPLEKTS